MENQESLRKNPLVGNTKEKSLMAEKIHPKDGERDWSRLKRPLKMVGQKHRGTIQESEQGKEEPSAVTNLSLELEVEGGEGNKDTEAPESTRSFQEEKRSWR